MVDPALTGLWDWCKRLEDLLNDLATQSTKRYDDLDRALTRVLVRLERLETQISSLDVDTDRRLRALENAR